MERFNRRLENLPMDWRQPLVDVIDTADAVRLALLDMEALSDDELLSADLMLGLTELVLKRRDGNSLDVT